MVEGPRWAWASGIPPQPRSTAKSTAMSTAKVPPMLSRTLATHDDARLAERSPAASVLYTVSYLWTTRVRIHCGCVGRPLETADSLLFITQRPCIQVPLVAAKAQGRMCKRDNLY